ncbi:uncharacterized protein EDB91DRAFT_214807 [Suillus paluster]|uniref:uncharacterized protein n=1 Tax=Suillus paluster TaxID=48578 RepID=UPI001B86F597|nr:uncharacterized protein EDB91DRAFT_214807 [Suillus paluster]KAG1722211.1 hypothetical protein EDB91DRAFT_214807 [Suillus paluster]
MNLLWANVNGIDLLLGCVTRIHPMLYRGREVFQIPRLRSEGVEPLSEDENRQFLRHAARVRSMHIRSDQHLRLLKVLPTQKYMFPRLLSLTWDVPHPNNRDFQLFLSPTLRHFQVSALHTDMQSIGIHCPALDHLSIEASGECTVDEQGLLRLAETIFSCKQLKHLVCPPLDWAIWNHLSHLPTILKVGIGDYNCTPFKLARSNINLNFAPFINLVVLEFSVKTAAYPIAVMKHLEFPALKDLEVSVSVLPWAEAEELFRILSQCRTWHRTLEDIAIFSDDEKLQTSSTNSLTATSQFFCFAQLRTLAHF